MAENYKNNNPASQGQQSSAPRTSRRRLLKAGAAVPVVFTLASGGPLAAMSAECDLKPGNSLKIKKRTSKHVWVGENKYKINSGKVTINGQVFEIDTQYGQLVTQSCWSSLKGTMITGNFT